QTVAYVNLDILGANLRPSLRNLSFAVAAESGGPRLQQLVQDAIAPSGLGTQLLSSVFGQARSDYVSLIAAGVPTVFFSDATGPCYHTDSDDWAVVDYGKLNQQIDILHRLLASLTATDSLPVFTTGTPLATYADAQVMTNAIDELQADLPLFTAAQQTNIVNYRTQLHAIVDAGPSAFDNTSITTTLSIAATLVGYFTTGPCSGFLQ